MSNANPARPADTRCPADSHVIECAFGEPAAPGVCRYCDLGTCSGCGAPMTPGQCAQSRRLAPVPHRNEVYCPVCLGEIKGDREAEEETVETPTLSDSELLALKMAVA